METNRAKSGADARVYSPRELEQWRDAMHRTPYHTTEGATLNQIIVLAQIHNSNSSSRLRLDDAWRLRERGQLADARRAALDSLRHSVGICHPDYVRAAS